MRIRVLLRSLNSESITANYFYPLSAAVYNLLRFGSPEFSSFLHDIGYRLNGKSYKLFTFALRFEKFKMQGDKISLLSPTAQLYISSPMIDDFIQNFVLGTFESQKIEIAVRNMKTVFEITQVESLPAVEAGLPIGQAGIPARQGLSHKLKLVGLSLSKTNTSARIHTSTGFPEAEDNNEMHLKLLSPMVLSTKREHNGKLTPYYLRYNDDTKELNRIFNENLKNKYELITDRKAEGKNVSFEWDNNYIKNLEAKGKRLTKKQTIKEGTPEQTEVIGNLIPFTIRGDVDLIRIGYEAGFGSMNSLGFGMAELIIEDYKIERLQDYKITRLQDYKITRLQD